MATWQARHHGLHEALKYSGYLIVFLTGAILFYMIAGLILDNLLAPQQGVF